MISIDEPYVDSAAPNADAAKNGRGLVLKGKFKKLHMSEDETLLFGECDGSGKLPYKCSCDFIRPDSPTHRCNCPSRQFPCKHCLGLMYAYAQKKPFSKAEVPLDLAEKRDKLGARVEKKKEEATKPKVINKEALAKKIKEQQKALDLLETLTHDLVRMGMGNTNAKTAKQIEEQAKQVRNADMKRAQDALHAYTMLFASVDGKFDTEMSSKARESVYSEALDQLTRLHAIIKQGRAYLAKRLADPELAPETESSIAAWVGHTWQLSELKAAKLLETDAELVQLAFNSYDDVAGQEFVDAGIWMNLGSGKIQLTKNYRPYKAAKYIKSDDSFFNVAKVPELCVYPDIVNPRIRWDAKSERPIEAKDYQTIKKHAHSDFAALIKEVKSNLKFALADKRPVYAINYTKIGKVGDDLVVEDAKGERLVMTERGMSEEPPSCSLFYLLPKALFAKQTLVARFSHDLDSRKLRIKPLGVVTGENIVRLTY